MSMDYLEYMDEPVMEFTADRVVMKDSMGNVAWDSRNPFYFSGYISNEAED